MPYHRPIPEPKQRGNTPGASQPDQSGSELFSGSGLIGAWIQAEKMIQIVLVMPCAAFIGWIIGVGLDRWLHQTWIAMAGIVLGIVAGLVGAIEMAVLSATSSKGEGENGDGTDNGSSGRPS